MSVSQQKCTPLLRRSENSKSKKDLVLLIMLITVVKIFMEVSLINHLKMMKENRKVQVLGIIILNSNQKKVHFNSLSLKLESFTLKNHKTKLNLRSQVLEITQFLNSRKNFEGENSPLDKECP